MLRRGAIRLSLAAGLLIGLADLSRADTIYIEGTTNDTLATLNPTTGAVQVIGSTSGILMGGLGFGANGVLYGIDASKNLYSINTSTGAATLLGSTGIPAGGDYALGATSDGTLYAQTSGELYLVNPTTHLGTLLGPLGFNTNADVNGDGSNNLYILNNNGSAGLYGVNKSNGQTTLIGTGSAGDVVGLAFADGTMYAMGYGGTTGGVFGEPHDRPGHAGLQLRYVADWRNLHRGHPVHQRRRARAVCPPAALRRDSPPCLQMGLPSPEAVS
jgi:hypothetical protein